MCRSHYVAILTWRGDYAATEREIETMRRELGDVIPTYTAQCDIRLGEIRRRQGRLDEAAALLDPLVARPLAMLSLAALALDRDEPQLAVDLVERYFRRVSESDRVRRLHGLELLVRAQLQRPRHRGGAHGPSGMRGGRGTVRDAADAGDGLRVARGSGSR